VCTDVHDNSDSCSTKKKGEPCNYFYECFTHQCTGSQYQAGICN
jgi:hypothetical protein